MIFRNICLLPFAFFLYFLFAFFLDFLFILFFYCDFFFFSNRALFQYQDDFSSLCHICRRYFSQFVICILFWIYGNFTLSNLLILFSLMCFPWLAFSSLKNISLDHDNDSLLGFCISFLSLL